MSFELPDRQAEPSTVLEEPVDGHLVLLEGEAHLVAVLLDPAELDLHGDVRGALLVLHLRSDALQDGVQGEDLLLHLDEGVLKMPLELLLDLRHALDPTSRLLLGGLDVVLELHQLHAEGVELVVEILHLVLQLLLGDMVADRGEDVPILREGLEVLGDGVLVLRQVVLEALRAVGGLLELLDDEGTQLFQGVSGSSMWCWACGCCTRARRRVEGMLHDSSLRHGRDNSMG